MTQVTLPGLQPFGPPPIEEVLVSGRPIRVKVGLFGAKPESADVIQVAGEIGKSALQVSAEALAAWSKDNRNSSK